MLGSAHPKHRLGWGVGAEAFTLAKGKYADNGLQDGYNGYLLPNKMYSWCEEDRTGSRKATRVSPLSEQLYLFQR